MPQERKIVKSETQARQGIVVSGMRSVLIVSTAAAAIILGALYFYFHLHH